MRVMRVFCVTNCVMLKKKKNNEILFRQRRKREKKNHFNRKVQRRRRKNKRVWKKTIQHFEGETKKKRAENTSVELVLFNEYWIVFDFFYTKKKIKTYVISTCKHTDTHTQILSFARSHASTHAKAR